MFLNYLKTEFYDVLLNNRVLLLVGFDIDALCACKILQSLLQCDNVLYTLVPVAGKSDLQEAFREHGDQVKYVVMINCGATIDVVEFLQPKEETVFFIADRGGGLIYNEEQVKLLMKPGDEEVPAFEDLFRDDESEEELSEDETGEHRPRITEQILEKRRERRLWEEKRHKIMFDYTQFSFFGQATALLMYELAWKLSRDTNELLWWGIVGLTDQLQNNKIEQNKYVLEAGSLQGHVSRHNHSNESEEAIVSVNCMKISFDKELQLALYRHWSLIESLRNTTYTACKFKLWTLKGQKKLHEFLAELGLPIVQCKQKFSAMDMQLRTNVKVWIEDMSEKYGLEKIVYGSFISHYGFQHKYCATDVVFAVGALLEAIDKEKTPADKFLDALNALSWSNINMLQKGIEKVKSMLVAIFAQVQSFLHMNHVISAGPFLYAVVQEGTVDIRYFSYPASLLMLAQFLLSAHVASSKSRRARNLPLVLTSPLVEKPGYCLVVGIPPISEESPKNFFGKAFEQAGEKTNSFVSQDVWDPA
ncbi:cell division control protein 45 homolog, partial [Limulus polyphemus]|uniref:Cell division control protein 45 homolog n=1 Tax=Limulus polyphemus TaxID=6850 RepID=A0ABM1BHX0_LIMPO